LPELTAKKAQETLDLAHITCNKNTVPFETRSPFQASASGSARRPSRRAAFVEKEMDEIASCIDAVLMAIGQPEEAATLAGVQTRVAVLTAKHPLRIGRERAGLEVTGRGRNHFFTTDAAKILETRMRLCRMRAQ